MYLKKAFSTTRGEKSNKKSASAIAHQKAKFDVCAKLAEMEQGNPHCALSLQ
jgi:hypothetical protein